MWGDNNGTRAGLGLAQIKGRGRSGPGRQVWSRDLSWEESQGGCCAPDPSDRHGCQSLPSPAEPGLEQQQGEEKEEEQGWPVESRTHRGTWCVGHNLTQTKL